MIKLVIFSMILTIAMAQPDGLFSNPLQGMGSMNSLANNKCFVTLLNSATSKLTISNLVRLVGCLLDQVLNLVEEALGGTHAGAQGTLLIKLLSNLRTVLMNVLNAVAALLDGAGGRPGGNPQQGVGNILGGLTRALPGLQNY